MRFVGVSKMRKIRHEKASIKNFFTYISFEFKLFDVRTFLQYTTYTTVLYFAFRVLSNGGVVIGPIHELSWNKYCATVIDRFGVCWWIAI